MAITINIYYTGQNGSARRFAGEMVSSGTAAQIRAEAGNLRYDYFFPMDDPETVLLIDSWADQNALDVTTRPHDGADRRPAGQVRPPHEGGALPLGRRRPARRDAGFIRQ